MPIIDFTHSKRQALVQGFLKGLGAPCLVFGGFEAPPLIKVDTVIPPPRVNHFKHDFRRIGSDFMSAIEEYDQKQANETKAAS